MIDAGVNAKARSTYAGHANVGITLDLYGHMSPATRPRPRASWTPTSSAPKWPRRGRDLATVSPQFYSARAGFGRIPPDGNGSTMRNLALPCGIRRMVGVRV